MQDSEHVAGSKEFYGTGLQVENVDRARGRPRVSNEVDEPCIRVELRTGDALQLLEEPLNGRNKAGPSQQVIVGFGVHRLLIQFVLNLSVKMLYLSVDDISVAFQHEVRPVTHFDMPTVPQQHQRGSSLCQQVEDVNARNRNFDGFMTPHFLSRRGNLWVMASVSGPSR
jgi:hypothetical protein